MKIILFLILLNSLTANVHAIPSELLNVEKAYKVLPIILEACVKEPNDCNVSDFELELLKNIIKSFPLESDKLLFRSGTEYPDFFQIKGGAQRIAVTGDNVGDSIYFNTDFVELSDYDIFTSILFLTHELGHHHGIKDDSQRILDQLGEKVSTFAKKYLLTKKTKENKIKLFAFNPVRNFEIGLKNNYFPLATIWVSGATQIFDVTKQVMSKRSCEDLGDRVSPVFLSASKLRLIKIEDNLFQGRLTLGWYCPTVIRTILDKASKKLTPSNAMIVLDIYTDDVGLIKTVKVKEEVDPLRSDLSEFFIQDMKSNTDIMTQGGIWKLNLDLNIPNGHEISKCDATISSPRFEEFELKLFDFFFDSCQVSSERELVLKYNFNPQTVKGKYFIQDIILNVDYLELTKVITTKDGYRDRHPDGVYYMYYELLENSDDLWKFKFEVVIPEGYQINECVALLDVDSDQLAEDDCVVTHFWDNPESSRKTLTITKVKKKKNEKIVFENVKVKYQLRNSTIILKPKMKLNVTIDSGVENKPLDYMDYNIKLDNIIYGPNYSSFDFKDGSDWQFQFMLKKEIKPMVFKLQVEKVHDGIYQKSRFVDLLNRDKKEKSAVQSFDMFNQHVCIFSYYHEIKILDENLNLTSFPLNFLTRSFRRHPSIGLSSCKKIESVLPI